VLIEWVSWCRGSVGVNSVAGWSEHYTLRYYYQEVISEAMAVDYWQGFTCLFLVVVRGGSLWPHPACVDSGERPVLSISLFLEV